MNNKEIANAIADLCRATNTLEELYIENGGEVTEEAAEKEEQIEAIKALLTGEGIDELNAAIASELQKTHAPVTFFVPFSQYGILAQIRPMGRVISESYTDEGTELVIVLAASERDRIVAKYGADIIRS